jgi:hypothetical protein
MNYNADCLDSSLDREVTPMAPYGMIPKLKSKVIATPKGLIFMGLFMIIGLLGLFLTERNVAIVLFPRVAAIDSATYKFWRPIIYLLGTMSIIIPIVIADTIVTLKLSKRRLQRNIDAYDLENNH